MTTRNAILLTPEIAYAAGHDAGMRSMRKACRKRWSKSDYNVACRLTNRLLDVLDPEVAAFRRKMGHR